MPKINMRYMPSPKREYSMSYGNLAGGLNIFELDYRLKANESPDMKNLVWKDGCLNSRNGQVWVDDTDRSTGLAAYQYLFHGAIFFHAGTSICYIDPNATTPTATTLYTNVGLTKRGTFFLYDTKIQRNIPVEELSFDRVNSRMSYFLTTLSTSQEKLWADNTLADNGTGRFGVGDVYRPLTAYKMLYDLVELDRPEGWALFLCATPATMDSLLDALEENGEEAMSKALYHAYNSASGREDNEWLRDFLSGNAKYLRRRMLGYVQKNIEWFY